MCAIRFQLAVLALVGSVFSFSQEAAVVHGGGGITLGPPPVTEARPVTDDYHGTKITDSYRWLEDQNSSETRAWIAKQQEYTKKYLDQVKVRPEIVKRLTELQHIESFTMPVERKGAFFFSKRLPDENQSSIYVRHAVGGEDEKLVDAVALSPDQNTSAGIDDVSGDGSLLAYGVREGGADEQTVKVLRTNDKQQLADVLPRARYNSVNFAPDNSGLYYSKFSAEGTLVMFHRFGTPVSEDALLFGKEFQGEKFTPDELISVNVTENGRYLLLSVAHGVPAKRVDIYAKDLRVPDAPIKPVIHGMDYRFSVHNHEDDLYVLTDYKAENYRVVRLSIADPAPEKWVTVVPESKDVITSITIAGGKLFATGLHDVSAQTRAFAVDGKQLATIPYPGLGASSPIRGRDDSTHAFYTFESFHLPPTIYAYDVTSGKTSVFAQPKVAFDTKAYEVKQVFYKSKDGTRIPMFISGKKGLPRNGNTPTLLFAYGGFNLSMTPHWDPEYVWWMEQGGYFAQPNLRAGGEYGETWHRAGMFEKKQSVFDDFYAAAEYLIANKYTKPAKLAIRGRSNGGLLMGAAMTQRPDLFGAIWCGYPLLDMLRFQHFLVGRWWTAEYGSADEAKQFPYLLKYSTYPNVQEGTKYPAIMFNTGDADTRVAPLHARKMTALMQHEDGSDRPVLLHYETKAGHSSGVSIRQLVNDTADELAFLWNETASGPQ